MSSDYYGIEVVIQDRFAQIPRSLLLNENVSNNAKLLYAHLFDGADRSDDSTFLNRKTLAARMGGVTTRAVTNWTNELIAAGYLIVEDRFRKNGSQTSNLYRLFTAPIPEEDREGVNVRSRGGVNTGSRGEGTTVHGLKNDQEPDDQEDIYPAAPDPDLFEIPDHHLFDEFWAAYPLKAAEGVAIKAWPEAKRHASPTHIIAAAKIYAEAWAAEPDADWKFMPEPAAWLRARRFNDDKPAVRTKPKPANTRPEEPRRARLPKYNPEDDQ